MQAEVQRQLGPLLEHIHLLEQRNTKLQQQLQPTGTMQKPASAAAGREEGVRQLMQTTAAGEDPVLPQQPQATVREGHCLPVYRGGRGGNEDNASLPGRHRASHYGSSQAGGGGFQGCCSKTGWIWWLPTLRTFRKTGVRGGINQVRDYVQGVYATWLKSTPFERVQLRWDGAEHPVEGKWGRLNARICTLLLASLDESIKQDLIARQATRSATMILMRLFILYQPGGAAERATVLARLQTPAEGMTFLQALEAIRSWPRWLRRCEEMKMSVPDGTVLAKALTMIVEPHVKVDQDVLFRMQLVRSTLRVDGQPANAGASAEVPGAPSIADGVHWHFRRHYLNHSENESGVGPSQQRQPRSSKSGWDCRFLLKASGCRRGTKCPFQHDMSSLTRQQRSRKCLACGSEEHRQRECPTKSTSPAKARPSGGTPGTPEEKGTRPPMSSVPSQPSAQTLDVDTSKAVVPSSLSAETGSPGELSQGKPVTSLEQMLQVAAQVLQAGSPATASSTMATLKVLQVTGIAKTCLEGGEEGPMALVDSGATHALRAAESEKEWLESELVKVALAGGESATMRMNAASTLLFPPKPDHMQAKSMPIIPMGELVQTLGYQMKWKGKKCKLVGRDGETIHLNVRQSCSVLTETQALHLISRLEDVKLKNLQERMKKLEENWFQETLRYVKSGDVEDGKVAIAEAAHFEGVPVESLNGLAMDSKESTEWELLKKLGCWNRSRRKALVKSKSIIIHLFAGRREKESLQRLEKGGKGHFVMSIDLLTGMDVRNEALWALLLKLAASGRVSAIIGGPPCRTFSILRFRQPGPRPLRSRELPHGLEDLEPEERRLVYQDTGYFCRFVFLHSVATAGRVLNEEAEVKEVAFFIEQPANPDEYLEESNPLYGRVPTRWNTPLWRRYSEEAHLWVVNFDQLPLGHPTVKPTGGGTNMEGVRCLDGIKAVTKPPHWTGPSSQLATWSSGLCEVIADGIRSCVGSPRIFKMTEEQWKEHVSRGHVPYRRDCLACVAGGGVGRRHARVEHPDSFVLMADTSGPLKTPGLDSHQRGAMKYMFVARLRVPTVFLQTAGCPMNGSAVDEEVIVEEEPDDPLAEGEPDKGRVEKEDPEDDLNLELFGSDGEDPPEASGGGPGEERDEPSGSRDGKPVTAKGDAVPTQLDDLSPPEMVSIVWIAALPDNKSPTVLEALQDVVYHARALNIPILRFHSDKSLEFYAKATRRWIKMNGMRMTASEGGVPQSNGLAEGTVKWAKQKARILSLAWVLAVCSHHNHSGFAAAVGRVGLHNKGGGTVRSQGPGEAEAIRREGHDRQAGQLEKSAVRQQVPWTFRCHSSWTSGLRGRGAANVHPHDACPSKAT